ncbi:GntR family transcriptional regulator [Salmonella enterica subsp. enterica serovar Enteritidis]|nr:GntR family transcriptional regulator [Salmonella enterica subsp. enterica serovar Enteritidis]
MICIDSKFAVFIFWFPRPCVAKAVESYYLRLIFYVLKNTRNRMKKVLLKMMENEVFSTLLNIPHSLA